MDMMSSDFCRKQLALLAGKKKRQDEAVAVTVSAIEGWQKLLKDAEAREAKSSRGAG